MRVLRTTRNNELTRTPTLRLYRVLRNNELARTPTLRLYRSSTSDLLLANLLLPNRLTSSLLLLLTPSTSGHHTALLPSAI